MSEETSGLTHVTERFNRFNELTYPKRDHERPV
jgi:hypothetical protein